jgi:hypothetical protein
MVADMESKLEEMKTIIAKYIVMKWNNHKLFLLQIYFHFYIL